VIATDLVVVVTDADGNTKTLDSDAPDPADRPRGIQFGTQIQSGFYTGGWSLRRAIDRDNIDLSLGDDVKIIGTNGDTAYEGFVQALPRSMDETTHTLGVTTAGWMAHASDRPFTEIFVDRDVSAWTDISATRQATNTAAGRKVFSPATVKDRSGSAGVGMQVDGPWPAAGGWVEAMYDASAATVASIYYEYTSSALGIPPAASWTGQLGVMDDDVLGGGLFSSNLLSGAATGSGTFTPATAKRYGYLLFYNNAVNAATASYSMNWKSIAVYGNHGLPLVGDAAPFGVAASDVIKYVAGRYCPLLDTSGVQDTTYPIRHLVFKDDTSPYDAFLKVNSYHLWKLAVWEDRTLYYDQIDLSDWDWEIRHDEVGNQIGLQGDDLAGLRNGIVVQYTDVTKGTVERLIPANESTLRDDSLDNPYTAHGRTVYGSPFVVPFPTTTRDALELGRLQLLEDNQAKAPGSFTVAHQIKDRAGNYQPVWKVRAGDRIRLTSSANLSDRPRLIQETSYSHDGRSMTIAVDSTLRYLEGFVDRVQTSLQANGLSG
jgi:hypothetical protein